MNPFYKRTIIFGSIAWIYLTAMPLVEAKEPETWLTGSLIAPVGTVIPYGDFLLKSYISCTADTGIYNQHWNAISADENVYKFSIQEFCFVGLTSWCDIQIVPQLFYNIVSYQQYVYPGDLTIGLDFQLMADDVTPYFPGIKLSIKEVFPTGNFQGFSPRKLNADQTGMGTFATQFDLVFYKVYHLHRANWLSTTYSVEYTVNTPVKVHGFNAYGGGFGTTGTILPGNQFQAIMSVELSLNQHWALALDTVYTHTETTQFFGREGITFKGTSAQVRSPSSQQFALAPAIEYNFSRKFGIIAGCFVSVTGKNSLEFRSGMINFNYGIK